MNTIGGSQFNFSSLHLIYLGAEGPEDSRTRIDPRGQRLPETTLDAQVLYFEVPPGAVASLREAGPDGLACTGALHAVKHHTISLFPMELPFDPEKSAGCRNHSTQNQASTIFMLILPLFTPVVAGL